MDGGTSDGGSCPSGPSEGHQTPEYAWDIKAFSVQHGFPEPSDDQLKYWRDSHVICCLDDGLHPSGHGRTGVYAPGTSKLVLRLLSLLGERRSLAVATWTLWREGYEVDERWTREKILEVAHMWDELVILVKENAFEGPNQEAFSDRILEDLNQSQRLYDRRLRLIRKLVGSKHFQTFMFYMVRLALGHRLSQPPAHGAVGHNQGELDKEQDIVVNGLGFNRMLIDRVTGTSPAKKADILDPLDKIADIFKTPLVPKVQCASKEDLLAAAREIHAVRANNRLFYAALSWLFGRHAFGHGHAARMLEEYGHQEMVQLTTLWVAGRQAFISEAASEAQLHEQGTVKEFFDQSERVRQLSEQKPGLKERIRMALRRR